MRTALYRHFDAAGVLLYVGISDDHERRLDQHRRRKPWFGEIARIDVEYHPTREAALEAEAVAIKAEKPLHNGAQRPPEPRTRRVDDPTGWSVLHTPTGRRAGGLAHSEAYALLSRYRGIYEADDFVPLSPAPRPPIPDDERLTEEFLDAHYGGKVVHEVAASPPVDWFRVLADLRAGAGLNCAEVARRLGVSEGTVRHWYRRATRPTYEAGAALMRLWAEHADPAKR